MRRFLPVMLVIALALVGPGCAVHQFLLPTRQWTARSGQLAFRGKKISLIGEVLVRFSDRGDFELTLTKGSAVTLLTVRTDAEFARLQGPLVGLPWSGKIAMAPARAQAWMALREEILRHPQQQNFSARAPNETLLLRF